MIPARFRFAEVSFVEVLFAVVWLRPSASGGLLWFNERRHGLKEGDRHEDREEGRSD